MSTMEVEYDIARMMRPVTYGSPVNDGKKYAVLTYTNLFTAQSYREVYACQ